MGVVLSRGPDGQHVTRLDPERPDRPWVMGRAAPGDSSMGDDLVLSPDHLVSAVTFQPLRVRDSTGRVIARSGDRYGLCGAGG